MPFAFARFATFAYEQIGPRVRDWVTVNEPMVHLGGGYVLGLTPPGCGPNNPGCLLPVEGSRADQDHPYLGGGAPKKEDILRVIEPARGLLRSHALAYQAIHIAARRLGAPVRVGLAHHLRVFDARHAINPLDWIIAGVLDKLWNWSVPNATLTGKLEISIPFMFSHSETIEGLAGTQDFFGINYYTRDLVAFHWDKGISVKMETKKGVPLNDLGWEIYPKGMFRLLLDVRNRFPGMPVLITENGVADRDDSDRGEFLRRHMRWVHRAIKQGVPIEGYCHWSLLDNFEWSEGFGPRFGLYEVDYATQARRLRPSGKVFSEMARDNGFRF